MKSLIPLSLVLLTLGACANGQPYVGGDLGRRASGPGIYETPISNDRVRIVHSGYAGLPPHQVEDGALLRAAERTVANGYDWFVVDQRYTEVTPARSNGPFVSVGGGSTNFGRRSAVGLGGSVGFNLGGSRPPASTSTLEVRMGRGAKPEGAYDARDVQRTIGGRQPPYAPYPPTADSAPSGRRTPDQQQQGHLGQQEAPDAAYRGAAGQGGGVGLQRPAPADEGDRRRDREQAHAREGRHLGPEPGVAEVVVRALGPNQTRTRPTIRISPAVAP
jgi:hypothetical protein